MSTIVWPKKTKYALVCGPVISSYAFSPVPAPTAACVFSLVDEGRCECRVLPGDGSARTNGGRSASILPSDVQRTWCCWGRSPACEREVNNCLCERWNGCDRFRFHISPLACTLFCIIIILFSVLGLTLCSCRLCFYK